LNALAYLSAMPRAEILTTQAMHTLSQLHSDLAGKIIDNKIEANRLRRSMVQIEAVMKMLDPTFDVRPIAVRRRKPNPWFKRGTVFRSTLEVLRDATAPMSAAEIAKVMLDRKGVKSPESDAFRDLTGAVQASLSNHAGKSVTGTGHHPVRWHLPS
jgi:hypothetical protein